MVLGSSGDYGMEVFVGGRIWKEYAPRAGAPQCDAFVESSLFVAGVSYQMETTECDPYGEEFTQSWPVTPYQVRLINRTATPVWFYLYVDGERAYGAVCPAASGGAPGTRLVQGMQRSAGDGVSEERALLFARPRLVRRGEGEAVAAVSDSASKREVPHRRDVRIRTGQGPELESIRCDFHAAVAGQTTTVAAQRARAGAGAIYDGVNKAACKKAKAGAMTRTGGVVKRSLGAASSTTLTTYTVNEVLDTVRIRYAQKDRLETYGVWPDDDSDEEEAGDKKRAKLSKEG